MFDISAGQWYKISIIDTLPLLVQFLAEIGGSDPAEVLLWGIVA